MSIVSAFVSGSTLFAAQLNTAFNNVIALAQSAMTTATGAATTAASALAKANTSVQTINSTAPDGSGNVVLTIPSATLTGKDASGALVTPTGGSPATLAVTVAALEAEATAAAASLASLETTAAAALAKANTSVQTINGGSPDGSGAITIATSGTSYNVPAGTALTLVNPGAGTYVDDAQGPLALISLPWSPYAHHITARMMPVASGAVVYTMKLVNQSSPYQPSQTSMVFENADASSILMIGWGAAGRINIYQMTDYSGTGWNLFTSVFANVTSELWLQIAMGTPNLVPTSDSPSRISLAYSFNGKNFADICEINMSYGRIGFGNDTYTTIDYDSPSYARIVVCEQFFATVPVGDVGVVESAATST